MVKQVGGLVLTTANIFSSWRWKNKSDLGGEFEHQLRERAVSDYESGLPVAQIAMRNFFSPSSVRRLVDAAGVNRRETGRPLVNREKILVLFNAARNRGYSAEAAGRYAASVVGCSLRTVYRVRGGR